MKYRLFKTAALTSAFIFACSSTTFAGTWTHNDKDGYNWDSLWFYVKDDGSYAQQEWIAGIGLMTMDISLLLPEFQVTVFFIIARAFMFQQMMAFIILLIKTCMVSFMKV